MEPTTAPRAGNRTAPGAGRGTAPRAGHGTALVTGASRGIGRAIAAALAGRGWEVIGTCRNPRALGPGDRVEGVRYLPLDLASRKSIDTLVSKVKEVEVLVNNAGASPVGPAEEVPIEEARKLFELNFFGAVRLSQAYLPGMRKRRRGAIVFIGSMRSEGPTPFSSLYSATKAGLRSFAECLRMEMKPHNVRVALVAPMGIRTTLRQENLTAPRSPYAEAVRRVKENRDRLIARGAAPDAVAAVVVKILDARRPRSFYTAGHFARVQAFLGRHLPRGIVEAVAARMFAPEATRR
jgi:short-subunit dehydrogenase